MTTITGNARFREAVAARLVLAMRPNQSIADTAVPDAGSTPTPGDYSIQVDTHQVILQAHAFDPANLTGPWRAETAFAVGDIIFETGIDAAALILECTAVTGAGETGATEPSYDTTPGNTTADNEVTWTTLGTVAELSPLTQFLYQPVLVSSVSPATGSVDGGTTITLTGSGLAAFDAGAGDTWTVGGNAVTNITVVSDTEMTGDTPASDGGATGSVDVVVTVGGESVTLAGAFEYTASLSYSDEVMADSPYGYWKLDETSGTVAADSSGNGRDGEYKGSYTLADSAVIAGGDAVVRTERSGYIEVPNSLFGSTGFTALTVECWCLIHTNSGNSENYLITHDVSGGNTGDASLRAETSGLNWFSQSNSNLEVSSSANVSDGNLHHVVMTYDGTDYLLYVDGSEVGSLNSSGKTEWNGTQPLQISGVLNGSTNFSPGAIIGEVAVYDHALSAQRVSDHYNAGS